MISMGAVGSTQHSFIPAFEKTVERINMHQQKGKGQFQSSASYWKRKKNSHLKERQNGKTLNNGWYEEACRLEQYRRKKILFKEHQGSCRQKLKD